MKLDNIDFTSVSGGNEIVLRKTEAVVPQGNSILKKLDAVYDEHARLLFCFDLSASMNGRVARDKNGAAMTDQFVWNPAVLAQIKLDTAAAIARVNGAMIDPMNDATQPNDTEYAALADAQQQPGLLTFNLKDDEDLKERILRADKIAFFGISPDFAKKHQQPPTRIELVRKLAKQEIARRFEKFPNSQVSVIPFSGHPVTLFDCQQPNNLWPALETLNYPWRVSMCPSCGKVDNTGRLAVCGCGTALKSVGSDGSTDILAAIRRAVELCRAKPSSVGIHHVIVVTDGEDYAADNTIASWVPALKQSGVVLDYIHIGDSGVNAGLKAACEALGGEYASVNCERELEEKFIAAVQRLMLPPAPTV